MMTKICVRLSARPLVKADEPWSEHLLRCPATERGYRMRRLVRHGWSIENAASEHGVAVEAFLMAARRWSALVKKAAEAGMEVDEYLARAHIFATELTALVSRPPEVPSTQQHAPEEVELSLESIEVPKSGKLTDASLIDDWHTH